MAATVVELMRPIASGLILDATFGAGGHSRRLLAAFPDATVLAIDRDPVARDHAATASLLAPRITFAQGDFADLRDVASKAGVGEVAGALFDLGVSSMQLDDPARGFSYRNAGPLDMRMGPSGRTAGEIVNDWPQRDLARLIRRYGEEPHAGRIAAAIARARPLHDTLELAAVVAGAYPAAARRRKHPARRTFQALRMEVNDELGSLERGLDIAIELLRPGGRIVVISYHSLEDRMVKRRFAAGATGCTCPPDLPICGCGRTAELRLLTRKALRSSAEEVAANSRSRSARLRAAERAAP
jgi:16S rRNA (cytosine1402-N4)-methyltransferase